MENTKSRLTQFIKKQRISGRKFSEKIGASENYFNVTSTIGSDYLEKIHVAYDMLNMDWVISGRGDMYIKNELPEPNFLLRNLIFLIKESDPHNSFSRFGKEVGIEYERAKKIFIDRVMYPSNSEIKSIAILFNISTENIIHKDLTKTEFEIDRSAYPYIWNWDFKEGEFDKILMVEEEENVLSSEQMTKEKEVSIHWGKAIEAVIAAYDLTEEEISNSTGITVDRLKHLYNEQIANPLELFLISKAIGSDLYIFFNNVNGTNYKIPGDIKFHDKFGKTKEQP